MTEVPITLERLEFRPGELVRARLDPPGAVREGAWELVWYTAGTGDEDVGVVATQALGPGEAIAPFEARLPDGPRSYDGRLVQIRWAVQLHATLQSGETIEAVAELRLLPPERR